MAYYAALISLKKTIHRLLNSPQISIFPSSRRCIKFAYKKVFSLQEVVEKLESSSKNHSKMVECLREEIRDAAYKLEDVLDSYVSDLFLSRSKSHGDHEDSSLVFSRDFRKVLKREINYFVDMVKKMEDQCSELRNLLPEEEDDNNDETSRIDFGRMESKMVGLSDQLIQIKDRLLTDYSKFGSTYGSVVSITGMAGIGKTTIAKEIFQDPTVFYHFDYCVWVTIGPKCQLREIMLGILAQLDCDIDDVQIEGDKNLGTYLYTSLLNKRYLIVLDDAWNQKDLEELGKYIPFDLPSGSRVILISRLRNIAFNSIWRYPVIMRFLDDEESWCLLREKVFGKELCPYQLEKAGKKIAKNCDGLPLLIVTVADLLSKAEKTLDYWNKVANNEDMSIFIEANDKISSILLKSYKYLPQELKPCFLYMGVFPLRCEIPTSTLSNLWISEELFELKFRTSYLKTAKYIMEELVSNNLALALKKSANYFGGIKTSSLHSSFWYACVKQSQKEKFFHAMSSFADSFREGIKSRRRLCIYNNVLFGIKEVYNSLESISRARSLICNGPYHQYPVPICFGLRLLKVLCIHSIRFYKFPMEVLKLIHLRYLALTYNGKVPASISKLWNLEYLIVHRHLSIKFPGDLSYLPVEIWNMKKLRHLQVTGSCLPYLYDALLPHLLKLSDMSANNCTKEILERIPNLEKLGIQIEIAPDVVKPLSCFDHLSHLDKLVSLKCVIVNPNPTRLQVVAPPSITNFPSRLKKLSLSGLGYPWEYMSMISKLPKLEVLKLRNYAFRGPEWVLHEGDFDGLSYLLLEDTDLVHLRSDCGYFEILDKLIIRHCYKLKEIPFDLEDQPMEIELIDSPLVANYVQEIQQATGSRHFSNAHVHSSWEEEE